MGSGLGLWVGLGPAYQPECGQTKSNKVHSLIRDDMSCVSEIMHGMGLGLGLGARATYPTQGLWVISYARWGQGYGSRRARIATP